MARWPVHPRLEGKLAALVDEGTHVHRLIPAYDLDFNLIPAAQYERKLRGALVEVHFALEHYPYPRSNESAFVPIVREMIIHRAPVTLVSPRKRGIDDKLSDGPRFSSGSPSKLARR